MTFCNICTEGRFNLDSSTDLICHLISLHWKRRINKSTSLNMCEVRVQMIERWYSFKNHMNSLLTLIGNENELASASGILLEIILFLPR